MNKKMNYILSFSVALSAHACLLILLILLASASKESVAAGIENKRTISVPVEIVSIDDYSIHGSIGTETKEIAYTMLSGSERKAPVNFPKDPAEEKQIQPQTEKSDISNPSTDDRENIVSQIGTGENPTSENIQGRQTNTSYLSSGIDIELEGRGAGASGTSEGALTPPVPMSDMKPVYPRRAQEDGIEGIVRIRVSIDETGAVTHREVIVSSDHSILDTAALTVIDKTRFYPAHRNKKPIPLSAIITIKYKLE